MMDLAKQEALKELIKKMHKMMLAEPEGMESAEEAMMPGEDEIVDAVEGVEDVGEEMAEEAVEGVPGVSDFMKGSKKPPVSEGSVTVMSMGMDKEMPKKMGKGKRSRKRK